MGNQTTNGASGRWLETLLGECGIPEERFIQVTLDKINDWLDTLVDSHDVPMPALANNVLLAYQVAGCVGRSGRFPDRVLEWSFLANAKFMLRHDRGLRDRLNLPDYTHLELKEGEARFIEHSLLPTMKRIYKDRYLEGDKSCYEI